MLRQTNDHKFDQDVLTNAVPSLVVFTAEWAGPCILYAPRFVEAAARHGNRLDFYEFKIADNPETPHRFGLRSVPCTYLFVGGEPKEVVSGAISDERLQQTVTLALEFLE